MITTILAERAGYDQDIKDARWIWLKNLLIYLNIDVNLLEDASTPFLVEYLMEKDIEITEYPSIGAMSVSFEGELIGEWAGPELTLKREDGKLYFQIDIENWSIIEEEISSPGD